MSVFLPPQTITVKRKRGAEDAPVQFLRVESSKRSRNPEGNWVYRRKQESDIPAPQPTVPTIQTTKEGDEKRRIIKPLRRPRSQRITPQSDAEPSTKPTNEPTLRRFHLSKNIVSQAATSGPVTKKRASTAVFVERSSKRKSLHSNQSLEQSKPANVQNGPAAVQPKPSTGYTYQEPPPADPNDTGMKRSFKRPGTRRFQPPTESSRPGAHPALPPSLVNRNVNVDMDQLAQEMDAYTLSAITSHLSRLDEASVKDGERKSKFKPKAPALRYAQRHPEAAAAPATQAASASPSVQPPVDDDDMDIEMLDTSDDDDYVIEEYYRVPASRLNEEEVEAMQVGLLVFDSEPDKIEFFFGTEEDDEYDFPEDEDDENHENYYAADYPDEDLEWDDELDRNPYDYRTGNASDREEFDAELDDNDDDDFVEADERFMDHVWQTSNEMADMVAYARGYDGDRPEPAVAGFPRGFPYE
ncbi:hypothetical protein QBC32DRAFT_253434 [Pseudoneurospora amorphoporcata]|uniref:Transcription factor Iwr1 domain-containing protein n=1 Tax=Pseudoneurospora amorphoporcata TaxID=241081 RepID=A0AAN6P223_9PEZI|nr:hypothetical protein QBC32DRAFT_253434 [Pseudoneurospora amorphoporcata]